MNQVKKARADASLPGWFDAWREASPDPDHGAHPSRSQQAEGAAESAEPKRERRRDGPHLLRCVVAGRVVFREKMGGAGSRNAKKSGVSTCEKVMWRFDVKGPGERLCSRKTSLTL